MRHIFALLKLKSDRERRRKKVQAPAVNVRRLLNYSASLSSPAGAARHCDRTNMLCPHLYWRYFFMHFQQLKS